MSFLLHTEQLLTLLPSSSYPLPILPSPPLLLMPFFFSTLPLPSLPCILLQLSEIQIEKKQEI